MKVDPNLFQNYNESIDKTDLNTLVYRLDVTCRRKRHSNYGKKKTVKHETDVANGTAENSGNSNDGLDVDYSTPENGIVYSSDLKWIKQGSQEERLKRVSNPDQCTKTLSWQSYGQGNTFRWNAMLYEAQKGHAKFSPVCTAHYRMMPEAKIVKDIFDDKARKLLKLMPGSLNLRK